MCLQKVRLGIIVNIPNKYAFTQRIFFSQNRSSWLGKFSSDYFPSLILLLIALPTSLPTPCTASLCANNASL